MRFAFGAKHRANDDSCPADKRRAERRQFAPGELHQLATFQQGFVHGLNSHLTSPFVSPNIVGQRHDGKIVVRPSCRYGHRPQLLSHWTELKRSRYRFVNLLDMM